MDTTASPWRHSVPNVADKASCRQRARLGVAFSVISELFFLFLPYVRQMDQEAGAEGFRSPGKLAQHGPGGSARDLPVIFLSLLVLPHGQALQLPERSQEHHVQSARQSGATPGASHTLARCVPCSSATRATCPGTSGPTRRRSRMLPQCARCPQHSTMLLAMLPHIEIATQYAWLHMWRHHGDHGTANAAPHVRTPPLTHPP